MRPQILTFIGALGLLLTAEEISAQQIRQPSPTGQVPKVYSGSGAQGDPNRVFQPRPTGQIAPEVPGQLGTIYQPAPATPNTGRPAEVQSLGFEGNLSTTTSQEGMVPKVNTTQDPLTMPERYLPGQHRTAITEQQAQQTQEAIQQWQQTQLPAAGTNTAPTGEATTTTQSSQTTTQPVQGTNGGVTTTTQTGVRTTQPTSAPRTYQPVQPVSPRSN